MESMLAQLAIEIAKRINDDAKAGVMKTKDVAEYIGVTQNEVRRLAKAGEIPHARIGEKAGRLAIPQKRD